MKMLVISLMSMIAVSALAESRYLDSERLRGCGGQVELRQADNGDLALKFEGNLNRGNCQSLRFVDSSSGYVIKTYQFQGSSYTLSQSQKAHLSQDCRVEFQLLNGAGYVVDRKAVVLNWCAPAYVQKQNSIYSYALSGKGNCKLMIGNRLEKLVSDAFCSPLRGDKNSSVSYQWSNKNNCKVMINGLYSGDNTQDFYCEARH